MDKSDRSCLDSDYAVEQRETLVESIDLRVRLFSLTANQCVPWHYHTIITDTFCCMCGPMHVKTKSPEYTNMLNSGDILAIAPGTPHYVEAVSDKGCKFIIIQGVGEYDYVPV